MPRLAPLLFPALLLAVAACGAETEGSDLGASGSPTAFEIAAAASLEERAPLDYEDLHNVFRLSETIYSGSEPHGEAALRRIAAMGVKTLVSVDGKVPDAETAARLGMRYVHVPIKYSGIPEAERLRLAKTFREMEGPFFVHCFHGRHRGPAAAAWGRVVLDGAPRERALAEMRQWCGTSKKYDGLYETILESEAPSEGVLDDLEFDFPAAHRFEGLRQAMVELARVYDNLKALKRREWKPDPEHPDLSALNEARKLTDLFAACAEGRAEDAAEDFVAWTDESAAHARELAERLGQAEAGDGEYVKAANAAFMQVKRRCDACHGAYRN